MQNIDYYMIEKILYFSSFASLLHRMIFLRPITKILSPTLFRLSTSFQQLLPASRILHPFSSFMSCSINECYDV